MIEEQITFTEFKSWLTGLIRGKNGRLPDLEDWKNIKKMMDRVVSHDNPTSNVDWIWNVSSTYNGTSGAYTGTSAKTASTGTTVTLKKSGADHQVEDQTPNDIDISSIITDPGLLKLLRKD